MEPGLQQVTFDEGFDAFPMLTNDGKKPGSACEESYTGRLPAG